MLQVPSPDTDRVHPLGTKLRVGGLAAELELSLLAVVRALSTRGRTFVPGGAGNTCRAGIQHDDEQSQTQFKAKIERATRQRR